MKQPVKKLIEVALPLEAINAASSREKSIRHGHPSTLHLWWSRKPTATARAVLWASLVDDPSSHPELFPTEQAQARERQRLHELLTKLIQWENSNNENLLRQARAEIKKYMGEGPLVFLDPFAGGGAIPLEAQRLGLEAHAHDLNPVAVMINKAMIEIPPKFAGQPPVNPQARSQMGHDRLWPGSSGLAEDVRYYGELLKEKVFQRIGHLYPKVRIPAEQGSGEATVIAWLWARTVKCPNPACACQLPLVNSFIISKKKGNEAWVEPYFENGRTCFKVHTTGKPVLQGTMVKRQGAICPKCNTPVGFPYIRSEGQKGRMSAQLMAIVAEGKSGRIYISPDALQERIANIEIPAEYPDGILNGKAADSVPNYGLKIFSDLFTPRQLTALTTFCDLLPEIQEKATKDAIASGLANNGISLADGGKGALAYGQAIKSYLAFVVDKLADINSSICSWLRPIGAIAHTFTRQAIPMTWDYAESNPFCNSSGCFDNMLEWIVKCLQEFPSAPMGGGIALQHDAQSDCGLRNLIISTDPPYYDNICYADISDFFYIWLRRSLKNTFPKLFRTIFVPKAQELVASPYRFNSRENARGYFEEGMFQTCQLIYRYSRKNVPVTIYYAYKRDDSNNGDEIRASAGWETMLSAIIRAGFAITGTWPMRTERSNRTNSLEANALASSIVLVCRKRPQDAPVCTRNNFVSELKYELHQALKILQESSIAPVDMAQAAIGPGIRVYSRYSAILKADGSEMTVREALQRINQELGAWLAAQDGDLDEASRFCLALFAQYGFNTIPFGEANVLANAKNISVDRLKEMGLVFAEKGQVHLLERRELPQFSWETKDNSEICVWLLAQQLIHTHEQEGNEGCARIVARLPVAAQRARDLVYNLYSISERKGWNGEALACNSLVMAWPEIRQKLGKSKISTIDNKLL